MNACGCEIPGGETTEQRRILTTALSLNAAMFVVGFVAGIAAQSTGLIADSLDMLADAIAYSIGLLAVGRALTFKAKAATVSGSVLLLLGIGVLGDVIRRALFGSNPETGLMLLIATISLAVNSFVLHLLGRYRAGEVHLRATWIFTRVDVIANVAVICAALLVRFTHVEWIDLVVGAAIAAYIIKEAFEILRSAKARDMSFS